MTILASDGVRQRVAFAKDEAGPAAIGFDGYRYEAAGVDDEGGSIYWREPAPAPAARPVVAAPPAERAVPRPPPRPAGFVPLPPPGPRPQLDPRRLPGFVPPKPPGPRPQLDPRRLPGFVPPKPRTPSPRAAIATPPAGPVIAAPQGGLAIAPPPAGADEPAVAEHRAPARSAVVAAPGALVVAGGGVAAGGVVTPNPSPFFPQQAAIDRATYGSGRVIGADDLTDVVSELQQAPSRIAAELSKRVVPAAGEGPPAAASPPAADDPRVTHYLLVHGRGSLARVGVSAAASALSLGISSAVEQSASAVGDWGLGTALATLARRLRADNARLAPAGDAAAAAHRHPDDLLAAIDALAWHYGSCGFVDVVKAIPFHIGTLVGLAQQGARAAGSIASAKDACVAIRRHACLDEEGAVVVAGYLGIPLEVLRAQGGEKALQGRL